MNDEPIGFHIEQQLILTDGDNVPSIVIPGIDEAGRGPLAGPVVAAAVVFPRSWIEKPSCELDVLSDLNDSKKLNPKKREQLFSSLTTNQSVQISTGIVDAAEIDRFNILEATKMAMKTALEGLNLEFYVALVDGLPLKPSPFNHKAVVKGDSRSYSIAAASIIAKVTRDRIMEDVDKEFPQYGFAKHKGYGTKKHLAALKKYGPTPQHRHTFAPIRKDQLELF